MSPKCLINLSVSPDVHEGLVFHASKNSMTKSEVIRQAIVEYLKSHAETEQE